MEGPLPTAEAECAGAAPIPARRAIENRIRMPT
jgi:hypothetical protein